jgi:hypothetical protein
MKILLKILIVSLLIFLLSISIFTEASNLQDKQMWRYRTDGCNQGLYKQPKGPMALLLFCEDALGTYIGLVYYDHMGSPVPYDFFLKLSQAEKETYFKIWSLDNRMWQDPMWASDVTSYAWGPDGTKLYIATSEIYGSGALYELDLIRKKYKQIAPSDRAAKLNAPGPGYIITQIDQDKNQLIYVLDPQSDNTPLEGLQKLFYKLK